jgi:hypothetical protein
MDDTVKAASAWSLHGMVAKLNCGGLSGEVDVARPHIGLFDCEEKRFALLAVSRPESIEGDSNSPSSAWPLHVDNAYVRDGDLVATYRPDDDWPYSPQLYWHADTLESIQGVKASLSLLVSVQTHLLDTWPRIIVQSQIVAEEVLCVLIHESRKAEVKRAEREEQIAPTGTMCCIMRRLADERLSYAEIMATSDFREVLIRPDSSQQSAADWHLFAEFLEKGVIRRARVQAVLLPRSNDLELTIECCRAFEQCPPPLTT